MCHRILWTNGVMLSRINLSGYLHPTEHVQLHVVCTGTKRSATEGMMVTKMRHVLHNKYNNIYIKMKTCHVTTNYTKEIQKQNIESGM